MANTIAAGIGTLERGVPVLSRGSGTSLAGQCTNTAVVIDWSKYCDRVFDVDSEQRTLRGRARHRSGCPE